MGTFGVVIGTTGVARPHIRDCNWAYKHKLYQFKCAYLAASQLKIIAFVVTQSILEITVSKYTFIMLKIKQINQIYLW